MHLQRQPIIKQKNSFNSLLSLPIPCHSSVDKTRVISTTPCPSVHRPFIIPSIILLSGTKYSLILKKKGYWRNSLNAILFLYLYTSLFLPLLYQSIYIYPSKSSFIHYENRKKTSHNKTLR